MSTLYSLQEIKEFSDMLPKAVSKALRNKLINHYCDTTTEYFRLYKNCKNGYFLWDCIPNNPEVLSIYHIKYDPPFNGSIYGFWDYYDEDNPLWGAGKEYIFEFNYDVFVENFNRFPFDTYIFNKECTLLLVKCHEVARDSLILYRKDQNADERPLFG